MTSEDRNQPSTTDEVLDVSESFVLPVGTPLQLEIEGIATRMQSVSIGWLPGNYIVIRQPSTGMGSIANKLFKGNTITVRYLSDGEVLAFQSQVVAANDFPRVIFIGYPTTVVRRSLRASRRFVCYLSAELEIQPDNPDLVADAYRAILTDISLLGCGLDVSKESNSKAKKLPYVTMNETVKIRMKFPRAEYLTEVRGEVRRTQRDERKLNIGIRFDESVERVKNEIAQYIETIEKSNG
jgi:hypothetical protein